MLAMVMAVCNKAQRQDEAVRIYEKYFRPYFGALPGLSPSLLLRLTFSPRVCTARPAVLVLRR
jgi:hypothetical protein